MKMLEDMANVNPLPSLGIHDLDDALCTFQDITGKGACGTGPRFYKNLPCSARLEVLKIIMLSETLLAWPWLADCIAGS